MSVDQVPSAAQPVPASLDEQAALEMQYDGPIPASALADLRACRPSHIAYGLLSDTALLQWRELTFKSLKQMQYRLSMARRGTNRAYTLWCFRQCLTIRHANGLFVTDAGTRAPTRAQP